MKIHYLIIFLILGLFASPGWTSPPGKGGSPSKAGKDRLGNCVAIEGGVKKLHQNITQKYCNNLKKNPRISNILFYIPTGPNRSISESELKSFNALCRNYNCSGTGNGLHCPGSPWPPPGPSTCVCGNGHCY